MPTDVNVPLGAVYVPVLLKLDNCELPLRSENVPALVNELPVPTNVAFNVHPLLLVNVDVLLLRTNEVNPVAVTKFTLHVIWDALPVVEKVCPVIVADPVRDISPLIISMVVPFAVLV